jgi:type IV pilus assembly protein PilN
MIKINLLGDDVRTDLSQHLALGSIGGCLAISLGLCVAIGVWFGGEIEDLEGREKNLDSELKRLQATTQEVKDIEKKQKDLESRLVRIATLKRSKQGPARVLDALHGITPERAWILDLREKGGKIVLKGIAIDGETVSAFMRQLEQSEFFPKVELDVTRASVKQGVKLQEFAIKADVSYTGRVLLPAPNATDKSAAAPAGGK